MQTSETTARVPEPIFTRLASTRTKQCRLWICAFGLYLVFIDASMCCKGFSQDPAVGRLEKRSPLGRLSGCAGVGVAYSGNGERILTANSEAARVWDATTLKPVTPPLQHGKGLFAAAISDDGRTILTFGRWRENEKAHQHGSAMIWDGQTGNLLFSVDSQKGKPLAFASLSSDGSRLAICAESDSSVSVWDVQQKRILREINCIGTVEYILLDRLAKRLLTIGTRRQGSQLWDPQNGRQIGQPFTAGCNKFLFDYPHRKPRPAAFSRDGRTLVVAWGNEFSTYKTDSGEKIADNKDDLLARQQIVSVDINADGTVVTLMADAYGCSEWDANSGSRNNKERNAGLDVDVISSDGKLVLCDGSRGSSGLFNVSNDALVQRFDIDDEHGSSFSGGCFSPDGSAVALTYAGGDDGGQTLVWKVEESKAANVCPR